MTGELVKFGLVMLVVMSGFVMSFYTMLRGSLTYAEVWKNVFKSMLGETDFFDEFSGTEFDVVATVLLVTYLVILTIMMLNLLIAVLTTTHARVAENIDREFKVSKARIIQHYVSVVKTDRLPAPFNIFQWSLSSPMFVADLCFSTTLRKDTRRFFGRVVFWAMLGPVAVAAGWLLWMASALKAAIVVWRTSAKKSFGKQILRVILTVAGCVVGAPLWLLALWVKGGITGVPRVIHLLRNRRGRACCRGGDRSNTVGKSTRSLILDHAGDTTQGPEDGREDVVLTILKKGDRGLGVGELQKYLDDPMSDPYVRRDEETRSTTVEHVKLLRNRLEATTQEHLTELQSYLVQTTANLSRNVEDAAVTWRGNGKRSRDDAERNEFEGVFNTKVDELDKKMIGRASKLEERVGALIDERLGVVEQRVDMMLRKAAE